MKELELYYVTNTPWKQKLNLEDIPRFNLKYADTIIFHFDYFYTVMLSKEKVKNKFDQLIASINVCLRIREVVKKLYPYNKCYVMFYTEDKTNTVFNTDTLLPIINIIPDFAVINKDNQKDLQIFNSANFKHIFYGKCLNSKNILNSSDLQYWSILKGKLFIK